VVEPSRSSVLGNRFTLERIVGVGGTCEVYSGTDLQEQETVAVKLLRTCGRPARLERFFREAALLAELNHPAVVRYIAHGVAPSGDPFLVMEWLEGETLAARLERGPLSPHETWRLARRMSEGLMVAHTRGIVHRDIKPSNVFLVQGDLDSAKLLDFGIAKRVLEESQQITVSGARIGTPAYMSPEQIRGLTELDVRSDVFSLGATLYECLAGKPAFRADNFMAVAAEICLADPPMPSTLREHVPTGLELLLLRMLEKDPARRPEDAGAVARLALRDHARTLRLAAEWPSPRLTH
jgi:serine/threonine protein kinase